MSGYILLAGKAGDSPVDALEECAMFAQRLTEHGGRQQHGLWLVAVLFFSREARGQHFYGQCSHFPVLATDLEIIYFSLFIYV